MTIITTQNFDAGGGANITVSGTDVSIEILNPYPYFLFRLDGVSGETVSFSIENPGDATNWPESHQLYYTDDIDALDWTTFDSGWGGGWSHTFQADQVYIANSRAYPYGNIVDRVNNLSSNQYVETEVIGQSYEGRDMHAIRIEDPNAGGIKKDVAAIARLHPSEVEGSFLIDAAIDYLLANADQFLDEFRFHFLPDTNPDGIYIGDWRTDSQGNDLNRQFDDNSPVEVANIKGYFRDNIDNPHWAFDHHSAVSSDYHAIEYTKGVPASDEMDVIQSLQDINLSINGTSSSIATGRAHEWYSQEIGVMSLTEAYAFYPYTDSDISTEAEGYYSEVMSFNREGVLVTHNGDPLYSNGSLLYYTDAQS